MVPNPSNNVLKIGGGYKIDGGAVVPLCTGKSDVAAAITTVKDSLTEDTAYARYVANTAWGYGANSWAYPGDINRTEPVRDVSGKYSWMKAPRWKVGSTYYAMEVGPFARLVCNNWYPVDGRTLASVVNPATLFGYTGYVDASGNLDSRCVDGTLATALAANGLATVEPGGGYGGIIKAWILALKGGLSTMDRLRARAIEALVLVQMMLGAYDKATDRFGANDAAGWIGAVNAIAGTTNYRSKAVPVNVKNGFGVSEAPRGALAHFCSIDKGVISAYQCVVPTTWNASPKDAMGNLRGQSRGGRGPMEEAMVGSPYAGGATPGVEALRIAQSFDPCIACAVH
ncbi:MAG: nickel-dependent hydrogenase large subunit [Coriobacteriia bacterium]|nr:nickel-dependent hydrogenase large subunit [Coriobacteriia bacterium]